MDIVEYMSVLDREVADLASLSPPIVLAKRLGNFEARLVTNFKQFEEVTLIRRAVFCEECGYDEENEFDGNDLCAAHILLQADSTAIACARIRFFAEFVLLERFSVLPSYRHSMAAQHLSRACLSYAAAKGYRRVFGVVRDRFVNFWLRMGGRIRKDIGPMLLGQYQYFPVELPIPDRYASGDVAEDIESLLGCEADRFLPAPAGLRQAMTAGRGRSH
jgi:predicted GNAT family N-acyltransferase